MIGIIAAMGSYAVTGQIIPGIFWHIDIYQITYYNKYL
jgi:hypothetical protein